MLTSSAKCPYSGPPHAYEGCPTWIVQLPFTSHISDFMFDHLHWLSCIAQIQLKILTLIYCSHICQLPSIYVTFSACLPLSFLVVCYVHLTGMISLSHGARTTVFQTLALHFITNTLLWHALLINWWAKCLFSFSQDQRRQSGLNLGVMDPGKKITIYTVKFLNDRFCVIYT